MVEDAGRTLKLDQEKYYRLGSTHPVLVILQGEPVGLSIRLLNDRTVIGRGDQADVILKDNIASRRHAEIIRSTAEGEAAGFSITDLSSTNGTFLNGAQVLSQHALKDGDKVKIGNHLLKFSLLDDIELEALLRSQAPASGGLQARREPDRHVLFFTPFSVPSDVDLLYRDSAVVQLEPRAVRVLRYLAEHCERVVPKDELLEAVWPDVFTSDGVLKRAVSQIRHALGDDAKAAQFIQTYHRRGYRFIAPVERRLQRQP